MPVGIGEAIAIAGTLAKALKAATQRFGKSIDSQAAEALLRAIELTGNLESALIEAQRENARLEAKILELEAENRELKAKRQSPDAYEQRKIGQAVVLVPKGKAEPYYCPSCAQTKHAYLPLQAHPMRRFGTHYCSSCKTSFRL